MTKARGDGRGVGGPRQGDGGADTCVCPECGTEVEHERGVPCAEMECPDCGTPMIGKDEAESASAHVTVTEKRATSFGDLPLGPRGRKWDRTAADKRVRKWADADDKPNAKYRRAFFWFDAEAAGEFGAYKLQFADVLEGSLVAIPRGIFAAAGAIQGSRGGVDIPEDDVSKVKAHIGRYYAKMRREWEDETVQPPWKSKAGDGPGGMEFKSYPTKFKVADEGRIVEAYASIFGNVDEGGDRANRGMFTRTIEEYFDDIRFCWQHDFFWPIGVPLVVEEDSTGLFTRSKVSETTQGNDALVLLRDGAVKEMSIGYNTIRSLPDEETGIRDLLEVHLMDYSPVTWGMNRLARVTGVKSGQYALALKRFAAMRDEITGGRLQDPDFLAQTIDTLKALRDAMPGDSPPSPNGDGEALDLTLKAVATDLAGYVQSLRSSRELEKFARSLKP